MMPMLAVTLYVEAFEDPWASASSKSMSRAATSRNPRSVSSVFLCEFPTDFDAVWLHLAGSAAGFMQS